MTKEKIYLKTRLKTRHKIILAVIIFLILFLQLVFLHFAFKSHIEERKVEVSEYANSATNTIRLSFEKCIADSETVSDFYTLYGMDFIKDFDKICRMTMYDDSMIKSMYFAVDTVVVAAYPSTVKEATIGYDMYDSKDKADIIRKAISTRKILVDGPYDLVEGGGGFSICNPIYVNNKYKAMVVVVIDWKVFEDTVVKALSSKSNQYYFGVKNNNYKSLSNDNGYIISNTDKKLTELVSSDFDISGDTWTLVVEPKDGYNVLKNMIVEIILCIVVFIISVVAIIVSIKYTLKYNYNLEHDETTALFNRYAFYKHARELLDNTVDEEYDLIIADIKNFKYINSILGEEFSNELLKVLSAKIREINPEGICGRFDDDQFIFISPSSDNHSDEFFKELTRKVQEEMDIPNLTIKYGVYENVNRELTVARMCDRAILALNSVKNQYGTDIGNYEGPISKHQVKVQSFEANFDNAIANKEFKIWYQAKHDTNSKEIVGAEALVRWQTPNGKMISPGEFVPTFEEDGLIGKLDEYVFEAVCADIAKWTAEGRRLVPVSINLSRVSLCNDDLVEKYKAIVEKYNIDYQLLQLEITESAMLQDSQVMDLTQELIKAGFVLCMDDFGSGVSSLSSLNLLPFSVIKLDKSLVDFIGDPGGNEIIRHTIELSHFKKMSVVAEGVENEQQFEFLRSLNCDVIQGYYFSKPKPRDEFDI